MRIVGLFALALALLAPLPAVAQDGDIVVHGDSSRQEIERILNADNLETERMQPSEVVEAMAAITRGRAPEDFWAAYQAHVQAWQTYAQALERAPRQQVESGFPESPEAEEAEQGVQTTFAEVERIARRYGARLPAPPVDLLSIA